MDDCCPTGLWPGIGDQDMTRRVRSAVLKRIGAAPEGRGRVRRKPLRTLLLAAAIGTLLLGGAAFAAGGYFMHLRKTDAPETGKWLELAADGSVLNEQKLVFPDAGMVLSFEGPAERHNQPEFRCWYLPSEANFGFTDAEGWSSYLSDDGGEGAEIPYIVSARAVRGGSFRSVINGEVTLVGEEDWGDWHVTKLTSDYTNCSERWVYDRANYVLLFDSTRGYLVTVCGTAELETLEHIARELEIRESGEPAFDGEDQYVEGIGRIDPGRG